RLTAHQHFAGETRRVYKVEREHRRERLGEDVPGPGSHDHSANQSPPEPATPRDGPLGVGAGVGEGEGEGEGVGAARAGALAGEPASRPTDRPTNGKKRG